MRPAVHARDAGRLNHQDLTAYEIVTLDALEGPTQQAFLTSLGQHRSAAHGGRMLSAYSSSVAMDVLARTLTSYVPRVGLIATTFHSGLLPGALCHAHQTLAISGVTAHRDGHSQGITQQGSGSAGRVVARVAVSISLVVFPTLTIRWIRLLAATRSLSVPRTFILVIGMAHRYIFPAVGVGRANR